MRKRDHVRHNADGRIQDPHNDDSERGPDQLGGERDDGRGSNARERVGQCPLMVTAGLAKLVDDVNQ
jgi:hypothetical protein